MGPHHFGNLDPDPHKSEKGERVQISGKLSGRTRIRIKLKGRIRIRAKGRIPDPDPHQSEKQDPRLLYILCTFLAPLYKFSFCFVAS
jgi:hypothetical protein